MSSTSYAWVIAFAVTASITGCRPARNATASEDDGGAQHDMAGGAQNNCTGIPNAAPIGQPCCLARGIDACAANSTCAALDGRSTPVCYEDHSREQGQTCIEVAATSMCSFGTCREDAFGQQRCLFQEQSANDGAACFDDSECIVSLTCTSTTSGIIGECRPEHDGGA